MRQPLAPTVSPIGPPAGGPGCAGVHRRMPAPGEHHPAFEEYCECIFELDEDDVDVIQARIAERLQVSRPAVSEMMKRLEAEGLIASDGRHPLTATGPAARRAHRAPPPPRRALPHRHPEALVGRGPPRGRPVGARDQRRRSRRRSTTCSATPPPARTATRSPARTTRPPTPRRSPSVLVGEPFTVRRIPEELEFTPGLLEFLEESAIQPGNVGTVTASVTRWHAHGRDRRPPRGRRRPSPANGSWSRRDRTPSSWSAWLPSPLAATLASAQRSDRSTNPFDTVERLHDRHHDPCRRFDGGAPRRDGDEMSQLERAGRRRTATPSEATLAAIVAIVGDRRNRRSEPTRPELVESLRDHGRRWRHLRCERKRPADADKASTNLNDLVDSFTPRD